MSSTSQSSQCDLTRLYQVLRFTGGVCGLVVMALGIFSLFTSGLVPRSVIDAVYQILFGALMIISELRLQKVLVHFRFLTHFVGLGLFYIFVGGLALDSSWYQFAMAIVLLSVGAIYLMLGMACRTMQQDAFQPLPDHPSIDEENAHATMPRSQSDAASAVAAAKSSNPWDAPPASSSTWGASASSSSSSLASSVGSAAAASAASTRPWDSQSQSVATKSAASAWGAHATNWAIENPDMVFSAASAVNKAIPTETKKQLASAVVDQAVNNANPFATPFE